MNTALWIVQGNAALMFMMTGAMKLMRTKEQMQDKMAWVEDFVIAGQQKISPI